MNHVLRFDFWFQRFPDHGLYHKYNFFMKDLYYSIFGLAEEVPTKVLDEMKNIVYYKPRCRPPYQKEILRFTLLQRNTSKESYHFFSIIAIVFFCIKAIQFLRRKGKISGGCTFMLDKCICKNLLNITVEVCLVKMATFIFFHGILASMIVGLNRSIQCVIKAIPKTTISDEMVMRKISKRSFRASVFQVLANEWWEISCR